MERAWKVSIPHDIRQPGLHFFSGKNSSNTILGQLTQLFSVQAEMLSDQRVFMRQLAPKDAHIIGAENDGAAGCSPPTEVMISKTTSNHFGMHIAGDAELQP